MGFPFYEEQRITVTLLLFAVSSFGEVDLSVTFDTRDVMFALLSQFRASSPPPKKKVGCFVLFDNKGCFFAINQKKDSTFSAF